MIKPLHSSFFFALDTQKMAYVFCEFSLFSLVQVKVLQKETTPFVIIFCLQNFFVLSFNALEQKWCLAFFLRKTLANEKPEKRTKHIICFFFQENVF